jgi:hypothetical protein
MDNPLQWIALAGSSVRRSQQPLRKVDSKTPTIPPAMAPAPIATVSKAGKIDQDALSELSATAQGARAGVIVVDDVSRLSRQMRLLMQFVQELRHRGIGLFSHAEGWIVEPRA